MNKILKKILKDDNVLLVLSIITFVSGLLLLLKRKTYCLINLIVVMLITRYFTNNIITVLLTGLVSTFFLSNLCQNVVENLENKVDNDEEEDENEEELELVDTNNKDTNEIEKMENLSPASLNDEPMEINNKIEKVGKLDHAASIEAAYDNLDKILSSNALQNMSRDTARLAEKQENLIKHMKHFQPIMEQASGMLKSFGKFDLNKLFENKN